MYAYLFAICKQFHVSFRVDSWKYLLYGGPLFINCIVTFTYTVLLVCGTIIMNSKAIFAWMSLSIIQGFMETLFMGLYGVDYLSQSKDHWTLWISITFITNLATRVATLVIAGLLHSRIKSSSHSEVTEVTEL